ncbi:MAG: M16 family metallopeptidase [Acidimicrobiales bacterium]
MSKAAGPGSHREPEVERTVLANGIRIVTERMPEARSVTTGFWVAVGGRDEPPELAGASHFLEHLVFKGSERRSAKEIAEAIDAAGGEMNAYTSREHTAYYTRLPASALQLGLDVLTDVLADPAVRDHELDAEREVILEELALSEDTPDDKVHTLLSESMFPAHPLGREVLGDQRSVEAMTRDDVLGFFAQRYTPANVIVTAAGQLDHADVVAGVEGFLATAQPGARPARTAPTASVVPIVVEHRETEQAHIALGWRAFSANDPDRYALAVANQVLGGGMASRLFQEVREERGMAYSVWSSSSLYSDAGSVVAYAGTSPGKVRDVLKVIDDVIGGLVADGITERELAVGAGYLEGSLLLALEDSGSRMSRLGRGELAATDLVAVDEQVARIRAVTLEDVGAVLTRVFTSARSLAAIGPFHADDLT